jgi:hypothetical protein
MANPINQCEFCPNSVTNRAEILVGSISRHLLHGVTVGIKFVIMSKHELAASGWICLLLAGVRPRKRPAFHGSEGRGERGAGPIGARKRARRAWFVSRGASCTKRD